MKNRTSHRRCSIKKGVLKNFANFTRKKRFPVKFAKFLRTTILKNIYERLLLNENNFSEIMLLCFSFLWRRQKMTAKSETRFGIKSFEIINIGKYILAQIEISERKKNFLFLYHYFRNIKDISKYFREISVFQFFQILQCSLLIKILKISPIQSQPPPLLRMLHLESI